MKIYQTCPSLLCLICVASVFFPSQPHVQLCDSEDEAYFQFGWNQIFILKVPILSNMETVLRWCNEPNVWLDGAVILICLLRSSEGERLLNLCNTFTCIFVVWLPIMWPSLPLKKKNKTKIPVIWILRNGKGVFVCCFVEEVKGCTTDISQSSCDWQKHTHLYEKSFPLHLPLHTSRVVT